MSADERSPDADLGEDVPTAEVAAALDVGHRAGWDFSEHDGEPRLAYHLRRIDGVIGITEAALLAFFVAALIAVGAFQAITGNVFGKTFNGTNEVIRYSVFCIAMTGSALAAQRKRLISMDVLSRLLSSKARAVLRIVLAFFTVAMCLLLAHGAWQVYLVARGEDYELVPKAISIFFFPAGAVLIAFHITVHAVIDALHLWAGHAAPEPPAPTH